VNRSDVSHCQLPIANFQLLLLLAITDSYAIADFPIGNWQSAIGNVLALLE
jgi:hypothetical protein